MREHIKGIIFTKFTEGTEHRKKVEYTQIKIERCEYTLDDGTYVNGVRVRIWNDLLDDPHSSAHEIMLDATDVYMLGVAFLQIVEPTHNKITFKNHL